LRPLACYGNRTSSVFWGVCDQANGLDVAGDITTDGRLAARKKKRAKTNKRWPFS